MREIQDEQFRRDGYIVIDTGIDQKWLDAACVAIDEAYAEDEDNRMYDMVLKHNCVKQIALDINILETLAVLYGFPMRPAQSMSFRKGTEQAVHSDTVHFNTAPAGRMCGVWVALDDVTYEEGPLLYYPGSHTLPEYTMADVGAEPPENDGYTPCPAYTDYMAKVVERENMPSQMFTCRQGQAIIWASNLLHGGMPILKTDTTRHSQVTHYYGADCTYYRPMFSTPGDLDTFEPKWIDW